MTIKKKKQSAALKELMAKKKFNNGDLVLGKTEEELAAEKRETLLNGALTTGLGMVGETLESASNAIGQKEVGGVDPNQLIANMKKRDNTSIAAGIGVKTAMGAAAGSIVPGLGNIIGAGAGALLGGVEALFKAKKLRNERQKLSAQLASDAIAYNTAAKDKIYGFKKGGLIDGKGTATSDSIDMNAKNGSFIVPEKNKEIAMEIGKSLLGWKDNEKATKSKTGKSIKVSNGEVEFTPNEVLVLTAMGIDLPKLAPESTFAQNTNKMVKGGFSGLVGMFDNVISSYNDSQKSIKDIAGLDKVFPKMGNIRKDVIDPIDDLYYPKAKTRNKIDMKKAMQYLPEALGTGQVLAGGITLAKNAGKEPNLSVSNRLLNMETEANDESKYGLSPEIRNKAERDIALKGRTLMDRIFENVGGSAQAKYNQSASISNQINNDILSLAAMDQQEKTRKKEIKRSISSNIASREDAIQNVQLQRYDQNQAAFAELLNAGIDNIVGVQKYKKQLEIQRKRKEYSEDYDF